MHIRQSFITDKSVNLSATNQVDKKRRAAMSEKDVKNNANALRMMN